MLKYWLWLLNTSGVANYRNERLINTFGNPYNIYKASKAELLEKNLISSSELNNFDNKDLSQAENVIKFCEKEKISIIPIDDERFPENLKYITPIPLVLFVKGHLLNLEKKLSIAMVGTRECTKKGADFAYELAFSLSKLDIPIVSGLAKGIDAAAHKGALQAGGYTVAFLANGVEFCYPSVNKNIYDVIAQNGAVISEFLPGAQPLRNHFPIRNRLISALSTGIAVIETEIRGGSIITAGFAGEQGRDLFAVPWNHDTPEGRGSAELIKSGAYPLCSYEDIIEFYSGKYNIIKLPEKENNIKQEVSPQPPLITVSGSTDEEKIMSIIGNSPINISEISFKTGIPAAKIMPVLLTLEMEEKVIKLAGAYYIKCRN